MKYSLCEQNYNRSIEGSVENVTDVTERKTLSHMLSEARVIRDRAIDVQELCETFYACAKNHSELKKRRDAVAKVMQTCLRLHSTAVNHHEVAKHTEVAMGAISVHSAAIDEQRRVLHAMSVADREWYSTVCDVVNRMDNCEFRKRIMEEPNEFSALIREYSEADLSVVNLFGSVRDTVSNGSMKRELLRRASHTVKLREQVENLLMCDHGAV